MSQRLAIGALVAALGAALAHAVRADGLTIDELVYIGSGWLHLSADYRLNPEQPPVAKMLGAAALLPLGPETPPVPDPPSQWSWSFEFVHRANDPDRVVPRARAPNAALTVALALVLWAWARRAHGPVAGLAALALAAFHPSLLAHGHLITTDLPGALTMVVASWAFWRWSRAPSLRGALLVAAALGLAVVTRLTGWLLLPTFLLLEAFRWRGARPAVRARELGLLAAALLVVVPLAIWGAYGFRYAPYPGASVAQPPGPWLGRTGQLIAALERTRVLPEAYLEGARFVAEHNAVGHPTYLLGRMSSTGWPHYYLVAFAVKNTPGFLLALGLASVVIVRSRAPDPVRWHWLAPAAVTFLAASAGRIQIGERYILPVYPYLILLAASAAPRLWADRRGRVAAAAALALHAGPSLLQAPAGYLPYFNLLAGGTAGGHHVLLDSNLDWGQDLPRLAAWMRESGVSEVQLAYHGSDDPERHGIARGDLPGLHLYAPRPPGDPFRGTVAVAPNLLLGIFYPPGQSPYERLRGRAPDARAGVFFVFRDVDGPVEDLSESR